MAGKQADRLSIALSGLITGAIILLCVALLQTVQAEKTTKKTTPKPPQKVENSQQHPQQISAIQLPPPPTIRPRTVTPALKPSASQPEKSVAALKPNPSSKKRPPPKPLKALKVSKLTRPTTKIVKPIAKIQAKAPKRLAVKPRVLKTKAPKKVKRFPKPKPKQQVVATAKHKSTGRVLLRMLEHGKGPSIEIAWPQTAENRRQLYSTLTQCYGMQAAVLHHSKALFSASDPPGVSWKLNIDRFSGFLRSPQGADIAVESALFRQIAHRHSLENWTPVRVFPRTVDAVLLGGLEHLVGTHYGTAKRIKAYYSLTSSGLTLQNIRVDGRSVSGSVELPFSSRRQCRV
ncbi:MAG: hypothetical protein GKS01_13565 [Alphaproteobacteria bacterium]|nr:hypothetical protein [Alphaproteobacteria bacterium]